MDLGAPIGQQHTVPSAGFDEGEHGAGTGLSGGHGHANASNTQAGQFAQNESSGFNAGVGGGHASGGLPSGTPIADKFSGNSANTPDPYGSSTTGHHGHQHSSSSAGAGGKLDNALDEYSGSGSHSHGTHSHEHGSRGDAVTGAYEGGGTRDALTGQSGAHTTGSGVGYQGENLSSGGHSSHPHGPRDAALAGTAAGAGALAGAGGHSHHGAESTAPLTRGEGVAGLEGGLQPGVGGESGSGVGPSGGSGGHYASGAGAGALGAGAAGAGLSHGRDSTSGGGLDNLSSGSGLTGADSNIKSGESGPVAGSGGAGKYGRAEDHEGRGAPISNPKDLDTGNPHSLVYQESTGKYVHRRELEGGDLTSKVAGGLQRTEQGVTGTHDTRDAQGNTGIQGAYGTTSTAGSHPTNNFGATGATGIYKAAGDERR